VLASPIIKSARAATGAAAAAAAAAAAEPCIKQLLIGSFDLNGSSLINRRRTSTPCGHTVQMGAELLM
jgi:hypothetical protein